MLKKLIKIKIINFSVKLDHAINWVENLHLIEFSKKQYKSNEKKII